MGYFPYSLCGILIATIRRPMRRTGRLASCNVTVPGFINIYLLVVRLPLCSKRIFVVFVLLFIVLNISNYSLATLVIASTCQY